MVPLETTKIAFLGEQQMMLLRFILPPLPTMLMIIDLI
jgi:hypothetical protein